MLLGLVLLLGISSSTLDGAAAAPNAAAEAPLSSVPVHTGYRDFNFGSTVWRRPTSEKPQSKLWWNDGLWWGCLWDPLANAYRIHRMDLGTQTWNSDGPNADNRPSALVDVLWAEPFLYILSHVFDAESPFRIHGYTYDAASQAYALRPGFPVETNSGTAGAVTIAKDTTGKLWISWEDDGDVWVNRSLSSETLWGSPFRLPVQGNDTSGDISVIASLTGRIGVLWGNQNDLKVYFATHIDGRDDQDWEAREEALTGEPGAEIVDDHLNIAVSSDGSVYAVSKTGLPNPTDPRTYLLHRDPGGTWTQHVVALREDDQSRPIVVLDDENRKIYVFAKSDADVSGTIRMKSADMDDIAFPSGSGAFFMRSDDDDDINDPTSTKQSLDGRMDLLVAASDEGTRHYFHNSIDLPGDGTPYPDITVVPAAHDYGSVHVDSLVAHTFEVRNAGTLDLDISSTAVVGADAGQFAIASGAGAFTLAPGGTRDIVVAFDPTSLGMKTAELRIESTDPDENPFDVSLLGVGVEPSLAAVPAAHDFGSVLIADNASTTFVVQNNGSGLVQVTSTELRGPDVSEFAVMSGGGSFALDPNDTRHIEVRFTPTSVGAKNATLHLHSDLAGSLDIGLEGVGAGPDISITPASHDFGNVRYGTTATHTFQVRNEGSIDLDVTSITLLDSDTGPFDIIGGGGSFTLPPGGASEVIVRFNPGAVRRRHDKNAIRDAEDGLPGQRNRAFKSLFAPLAPGSHETTLQIVSDDPDENPLGVALRGTGVHATATGSVAFQESIHGGSSESVTVSTAGAVAGVGQDLYLAAIATKKYEEVVDVTGMGLTWERVLAQCGGRHQTGVEVWMGRGNPNSGVVTATMAAAPDGATIIVSRYSGADNSMLGTIVGANTHGVAGTCDGGTDGVSYAVPIVTTVQDAVLFTAVAMRDKELTIEAPWVQRDFVQGGSGGGTAGVAVLDQTIASPGNVTIGGSFDEPVDWAIIAIEIRPGFVSKHVRNTADVTQDVRMIVRNGWGGRAPRLEFASPRATPMHVAVYTVRGRLVRTLFDGTLAAGRMELEWNDEAAATKIPTGVYFVRATLDTGTLTRRIMRVR